MKRQSKRCGIIFHYNGHYLCVVQRASGLTGFPKGSLYARESYENCALRELYEETGLKLNYSRIKSSRRILTHQNHIYFVVQASTLEIVNVISNGTHPVDENEILQVEWLTLAELKQRAIASFTKEAIFKLELIQKSDSFYTYFKKLFSTQQKM